MKALFTVNVKRKLNARNDVSPNVQQNDGISRQEKTEVEKWMQLELLKVAR